MVRFKEARQRRGLSQVALAARACVGASTVHRIERGESAPRPAVARRLAAALGVPRHEVAELREVKRAAWGRARARGVSALLAR